MTRDHDRDEDERATRPDLGVVVVVAYAAIVVGLFAWQQGKKANERERAHAEVLRRLGRVERKAGIVPEWAEDLPSPQPIPVRVVEAAGVAD